ncbi:MAG: CRTAC1 family protein [Acidobacteriia bacterium]|nr:CRTAC1 family protein [Terriglobia bacterium]
MRISSSLAEKCAALTSLALLALGAPHAYSGAAGAPLRFVNVAGEVGLTPQVAHGGPQKNWIAEANGSGTAVLDYDNDGWMDILIVSGATMSDLREIVAGRTPSRSARRVYLYRNLEGREFEDVTEESGLACQYWSTGANAADYDNDGDVDVLITTIGRDLLYRNDGDGRFTETGVASGLLDSHAWHTGSSFGDIDADGDLDLYVAAYLRLDTLPVEGEPPVCDYRGLNVFCGPMQLEPGVDVLYRNNGDGTFSDITDESGVLAETPGYGFTPLISDFNGDGLPDIFVSNDSSANFLFVNQGGSSFLNDALAAGLAYNADGETQADMGVCVGDYDGDGDPDLLTTTFSEDHFPLFQQQEPGLFEDVSFRVGLRNATVPYLGWGCGFSDLDNDGDGDLWVANGHVYPTAGELATTSYHQRIGILENIQGRFGVSEGAVEQTEPSSYRGAASVDFDNDGRIDLLMLPIDGIPAVLRNRSTAPNSWLGVRLQGTRVNREGIGALVEVEFCGKVQVVAVRNGGSYASRSDPRVHVGIGNCDVPGRVTVEWARGRHQELENVRANQWVTLEERGTPE